MNTRFDKPFFLGFDHLERSIATAVKSGTDSYPPYDVIEQADGSLRISVAVAGFAREELSVTVEGDQLVIAGKRLDRARAEPQEIREVFLHKGISTRQFKRRFLLGKGMEVTAADLSNGLLHIDLRQRVIEPDAVRIDIKSA